MPFSLIPFLLLIVPIVEIAVFVVIGGRIGVFYTLMLIVVTAFLGTILLRVQGFQVLAKVRSEFDAGRLPGRELGDGAMILVAGILLLTPGFVTDTIGFLLFAPPVRTMIWAFLASRIKISSIMTPQGEDPLHRGPDPATGHRDAEGPVIELEDDEYSASADPSSPWNK